MFGRYSYIVYMLFFTLLPIGILWVRKFQVLKKNIRLIAVIAAFGLIYQLVADPFAEAWSAWFFSEDKTLGIRVFNFPIENILFFVLVFVAIASGTIVFIER